MLTKPKRIGVLTLLVPIVFVMSCGSSNSSSTSGNSSNYPLGTAIITTDGLDLSLNQGVSQDVDPLQITFSGFDCGTNLIIDGSRTTFDTGAIQVMSKYAGAIVDKFPRQPFHQDTFPHESLPNGVKVIPGMGDRCIGSLDLTNTSNDEISISQIGIQSLKTLIVNHTPYNLIDYCSLNTTTSPCAEPQFSSVSSYYVATFDSTIETKGSILFTPTRQYQDYSKPYNEQPAVPLILPPSQNQNIYLEVDSKSNEEVFISLILSLSLAGSTKQTVLPESFNQRLVFGGGNNICSSLVGDTFKQRQDWNGQKVYSPDGAGIKHDNPIVCV